MSQHGKNGGRRKDIKPPLMRAYLRLEESKRRGETSRYYEEEVERLSKDPAQVVLACDFVQKLERLTLEVKLKEQRANEAFKALTRTDLTRQDVKEVIKALTAYEELGLTMAQLKVDWAEELRWHPWKKGI